jgi:Repeat of unknown function (DUF346)
MKPKRDLNLPSRLAMLVLVVGVLRPLHAAAGWTEWTNRGGAMASGPSVATWEAGRLHTFARGQDGQLWHLWYDSYGWGSWENLGGAITADPDCVSWGPGQIDCFARGSDGAIWQKSWTGGRWMPWISRGGNASSGPSVTTWEANRLHIFARGENNALWHLWYDSFGWGHWEDLGGVITSDPDCTSWGKNRIDCVARGQDGAIWHKAWTGAGWSAWVSRGGNFPSGGTVATWEPDRLHVFARGHDNALWHLWYDSYGWGRWENLGGVITSDPDCVSWGRDRIDCMARGVNGAIFQKSWSTPLAPPPVSTPPQPPTPDFVDTDGDGLSDAAEKALLAKFRPYYKFSLDSGPDKYHPTDVLWFAQLSKLVRKGTQVIGQAQMVSRPLSLFDFIPSPSWEQADIWKHFLRETPLKMPAPSKYKLDVMDSARRGEPDMQRVRDLAVGLYGHVVPLRENVRQPALTTGYKVEYWQFFAYNDAVDNLGKHEGDWETIQVVVEPNLEIRRVIHEVHGQQIRFDLKQGRPVMRDGFLEYEGTGRDLPQRGPIDLYTKGPAGIEWAQQNLLQLHCEAGECTHPIVYIEHSGHAFWPTPHWIWPFTRKHNGQGEQYLTAPPCNLGEVWHPDPSCGDGGQIVLRFTGRWGNYKEGPQSPPQKDSWGTP